MSDVRYQILGLDGVFWEAPSGQLKAKDLLLWLLVVAISRVVLTKGWIEISGVSDQGEIRSAPGWAPLPDLYQDEASRQGMPSNPLSCFYLLIRFSNPYRCRSCRRIERRRENAIQTDVWS